MSGHLGAANSAALSAASITAASNNPEGGLIRHKPGSQEPNGVLEETATSASYFHKQSVQKQKPFADQIAIAINYYASFGIITIQDGGTMLDDLTAL